MFCGENSRIGAKALLVRYLLISLMPSRAVGRPVGWNGPALPFHPPAKPSPVFHPCGTEGVCWLFVGFRPRCWICGVPAPHVWERLRLSGGVLVADLACSSVGDRPVGRVDDAQTVRGVSREPRAAWSSARIGMAFRYLYPLVLFGFGPSSCPATNERTRGFFYSLEEGPDRGALRRA